MPKVDPAYLEARRGQVLDAALACFARKGFHETTIADIAREAGVSYGVVYHYFRSKEDMIEATWQKDSEARAARYRLPRADAPARERLDELLDVYVERMEEPESTPGLRLRIQLFGEALLNPRIADGMRRTWDDVVARIEGVVRRGQERGEVERDLDPSAVARLLLAVHDGLALQKTVAPSVDVRELVEAFRALQRGEVWRDPAEE